MKTGPLNIRLTTTLEFKKRRDKNELRRQRAIYELTKDLSPLEKLIYDYPLTKPTEIA